MAARLCVSARSVHDHGGRRDSACPLQPGHQRSPLVVEPLRPAHPESLRYRRLLLANNRLAVPRMVIADKKVIAVSGDQNMIGDTYSVPVTSSMSGSLVPNLPPSSQRGLPRVAAKTYAVDNRLSQPDENKEGHLPYVLYIDGHQLGRDCVSSQFAALLPEWTIESASKA